MVWMVNANQPETQKFVLVKGRQAPGLPRVETISENGILTIHAANRKLLSYYFKTLYPPDGIDSSFRRSGFIHPLWSPHGQVLTRIQPKDHYHHFGLWNPWTHVLFEGDTVDFWNIGDKKGTVRFSKFISTSNGSVFSEYKAIHEHLSFMKAPKGKVAIHEIQSVRVYQPQSEFYIMDFTSEMNCADSKVWLLQYRYGGLGWRTTEQWDNKNSEVMSSEGKTRKDADGSTARWCIVQGAVDNDYAGALLMSFPGNFNHPEPLRIWPENQYDRGDLFANFSPTKNKDWLLEPGKSYTLKYRLLVFNGKLTREIAESIWDYFANPPKVEVVRR